jgi:hypothetical protein
MFGGLRPPSLLPAVSARGGDPPDPPVRASLAVGAGFDQVPTTPTGLSNVRVKSDPAARPAPRHDQTRRWGGNEHKAPANELSTPKRTRYPAGTRS